MPKQELEVPSPWAGECLSRAIWLGHLLGQPHYFSHSIFSSSCSGQSISPVRFLLISCLEGKGLSVSVRRATQGMEVISIGNLQEDPERAPRPLVFPSEEYLSNVQLRERPSPSIMKEGKASRFLTT